MTISNFFYPLWAVTETSEITEDLQRFLVVLSVSLTIATLSRLIPLLQKIPYTIMLVIVGLGLAALDIKIVELSPELILEIFLPPLLFEAAWNVKWRSLRTYLLPVLLLAVIGVIISLIGITGIIQQFNNLSIPIALLIAACLSATDPVSVLALFKQLGASEKLMVIMEGESLLNDGVAVVAFMLLVGLPSGQTELGVASTIIDFSKFVGVGIAVGCLIGFGISYVTQRFDYPLVEQSLTLVTAYGSYLLAEELGGSGVIGVVATGIILGNFGSRIGMSPRTRLFVTEFWEFVAFFVNSIIFLLIGDQVSLGSLRENLPIILVAIVAMVLTRAISVYGLINISNLFTNDRIDIREQTVIWWGGLRGSVAIALVLSVPNNLPEKPMMIDVIFGVTLFTLLVQGLTMSGLLNKLNLISDQSLQQEYSELVARQVALQKIKNYLEKLEVLPTADPEYYQKEMSLVTGQLASIGNQMGTMLKEYPELREFTREKIREKLLDIEADAYANLISLGALNKNLSPYLEEVLIEAVEDENY
jgi:CPA1 family monovalent cation:H+ antiporter